MNRTAAPCDLVTAVTVVARLEAITSRLQRLAPCHRDPERFHVDKSEIVAELRRMAVEARRG